LQGGLTLQGLPLTWQGLSPEFAAKASPDAVDVILSGPLPRLDTLKRSEVQVIIDVYGLTPGVHKITPTVIVPEGIKVESVLPDIVEVQIAAKGLPPTTTPPPSEPAASTP
jgi:YbbR domain-containing protein